MKCQKCNIDMVSGIAIKPQQQTGVISEFNFPITHKTMNIINVLKCPNCGHSDDGKKC